MSAARWTWRALPLAGALLLSACAAPNKPLYLWEGFPRQQYEVLQRTGLDANAQIQALQAHAEKARAAGAALPPGFRAHLGMLQLSVGAADQARASWQAEKLAFPESAPYMDQLLKRLDGAAAAQPTSGNPS
ncbi:DUF4810 domain-containing protein [Pseudorhodoferax sp.]|uniref:DUF4810 domain-containing protein n=1 Tax=Pseudorhodoferax sp. TaxID=1993553 RepID=UPI002DD6B39F|nr:DUF4810 domain-containing protein [Pseudorhodoferax sp.]